MKWFNWKHGLALTALAALIGFMASEMVQSTPSGKNAGWFRNQYPAWRPQFQTVVAASVAANTSMYCPGIKTADHIFLCMSLDSLTTNRTRLVNLTDSTYVQDIDTIRCGTATGLEGDLLVGWNKSNY